MTNSQPEKEKRVSAVIKKRKLLRRIVTEVWEIKNGKTTYTEDKTRTVDFDEEEKPRMGFGEK